MKENVDIAVVEKPVENNLAEKVEVHPQGSKIDAKKDDKDVVMN